MKIEPKILFEIGNQEGTRSQMLYFGSRCKTFDDARKYLEQQGLVLPTFEQMAMILGLFSEPRVCLINCLMQKDLSTECEEDIFSHIAKARKLFFETRFMTNTVLYFVKNKGVYIVDNPGIKDNGLILEEKDLEKRSKEKDSLVKFVSHGFGIESLGLDPSEIDEDYDHSKRFLNRYHKGDVRIKADDLHKIPLVRELASGKGVLNIANFARLNNWRGRVRQSIVPDWRLKKANSYTRIATLEEVYTGPFFGRELVISDTPLDDNLNYAFAIKNL